MKPLLYSRRDVYKILEANGVDTPRYEVYNHADEGGEVVR